MFFKAIFKLFSGVFDVNYSSVEAHAIKITIISKYQSFLDL